MNTRVLVAEGLLAAVDQYLAAQEPERLMHVLGTTRPDGSIALTQWVFDDDAASSPVHVQASARGQESIQRVERDHCVSYLGILHSHPIAVPEPSLQDSLAAQDLLARNVHLRMIVVGVVVGAVTGRPGPHVNRLPHGELAVHVARRGEPLASASVSVLRPNQDFFVGISQRLPQGAMEAVTGAHVLVVGAGSIGSTSAEHLVRAGIPRFTLVDPDKVESVNLLRTVYRSTDIGRSKVHALRERLQAINPEVRVDVVQQRVAATSFPELSLMVADCDLVLGLADDPRAMAVLDTALHENERPGVFAGVYRGAVGGDIVTVVPGLTACYRCTVAPRVHAHDLLPGIDYGSGRLEGEVALGSDVAVIAAITSRVSLGVLGAVRGTDGLLESVVADGRTFLQIGLAPGFFDSTGLFAGVPGQHTYQSIWVRAEGDTDCPECGTAARSIQLRAQQAAAAFFRGARRRRPGLLAQGSSRRLRPA